MAIRVHILFVLLLLAVVATRPAMATSRISPIALPVLIPLKTPSPAPAFINVTIIAPPPTDYSSKFKEITG